MFIDVTRLFDSETRGKISLRRRKGAQRELLCKLAFKSEETMMKTVKQRCVENEEEWRKTRYKEIYQEK